MEPQERGNVPARHTPERDKRLGLSNSRIERARSNSWAECRDKKVSAPSRRGDISLDIPFYRTSPVTAFPRTLDWLLIERRSTHLQWHNLLIGRRSGPPYPSNSRQRSVS